MTTTVSRLLLAAAAVALPLSACGGDDGGSGGELTGQAAVLPELRAACAAAVARLLAPVPDVVAVVGPGGGAAGQSGTRTPRGARRRCTPLRRPGWPAMRRCTW